MFRCSKGDGSVDSLRGGRGDEDAGQIGKGLMSEICRSLSLVLYKKYFNFQRIGPEQKSGLEQVYLKPCLQCEKGLCNFL